MKKIIYITILLLSTGWCAFGQSKTANLYDSAHIYYKQKKFDKALYFYDTYYSDPQHGQSNYDTYYAAVAACHAGNKEKAVDYLTRSGNIGYDVSAYDTFANDPDNICLRDLPEWKKYITVFKFKTDSANARLKKITDVITDSTIRINTAVMGDDNYWKKSAAKKSAPQLLLSIQNFNRFPQPTKTGHWTLYKLKVNDTLTAPYLVYIPKNYKSGKKTPLFIFLHGAVSGPPAFNNQEYATIGQNELLKRAFDRGAFVILPFAKKDFNWLRHQEAFEAVISEVNHVKTLYNIDDNRIYLGGHSDGGRGAVWFALNKATTFAAFYGINYFPSLYTGNTPLRNMTNGQAFFGITGTDDFLFPPANVTPIIDYAIKNGGDWHSYIIKADHGLPYSSPDSIYFVFDSLLTKTRNTIPRNITYETADIRNGRYFWIGINKLDTLADAAPWYNALNPPIRNKQGELIKGNFNRSRSGTIIAGFAGNVFNVKTSRIKNFSLYLMPGITDLRKPVTVIINGERKFTGMVKPDKSLILSEFLSTRDRTLVPIKRLDFTIPQ